MFTKTDIEKYFSAEKSGGLLILIIGVAAVSAGIVFLFFIKSNFYKGAAVPLLLAGLLLGVTGFTVYKRSDADRTRNVYAYDMNPNQLKEKEIPRMQQVMEQFKVLTYVELALLILGLTLFFYFKEDASQQFWKGVGVAFALLALLALCADYFAEKRAAAYLQGLSEWVAKQ